MTAKLYEEDPYKTEFKANIEAIKAKDNSFHVVLDKTYFYPEGGGQPSDVGWIEDIKVNFVYKENGEVIHVIKKEPKKKKGLNCKINWERRFDFMQQHTGQHLLSAVFKNQFNLNTVGFSLSENSLRIDLDNQIEKHKIKEVEEIVNDYIYQDIKVEILYPNEEELDKFALRKEPTVEGNIRVIKIGEVDFSPCGGTHLKSTGELGIIKIINVDNYKGGLRIDFVCGKRALNDYDFKNDMITKLRDITSVPDQKLLKEVKRIKKELKESEETIIELNKKLLNYKADDLWKSAYNIKEVKVIKNIFSDIPYNDVQWLSDILTKKDDIICIFGQYDKSTARLLLSKSDNIRNIDMNELINTPLEYIEGRGGGSKQKAQGGGSKVKNIEQAVESAFDIIKNKI